MRRRWLALLAGFVASLASPAAAGPKRINELPTQSLVGRMAYFAVQTPGDSTERQTPFVAAVENVIRSYTESGATVGGGGDGTVTSVGVSGADGIGVSGSPVTTSGTIALTLGNITPDSVNTPGTVTAVGTITLDSDGFFYPAFKFADTSGNYAQIGGFDADMASNANLLFRSGLSGTIDYFVHESLAQSLFNKKLGSLTSNGFVKTSGGDGTLSVDTGSYQPLDSDLTSWAGVTRASGFDAWVASPTSALLRALVTDEEGTGALLFAGGNIGAATGTSLSLSSTGVALQLAQGGAVNWGGTFPWYAKDVSGNLVFGRTATDRLTLTTAALYPTTAGGLALGGASNGWSGLYLDETGAGTDAGLLRAPSSLAAGVTWDLPGVTGLLASSAAALTAGGVPYIDANGQLAYDADLAFATDTLTAKNLYVPTNANFETSVQFSGISIYDASESTGAVRNLFMPRMVQQPITLVNGNNNNVAVYDLSFYRISGPTGAFTITGIAAPSYTAPGGAVLYLYNSTSQNMTIANQSASSTAANRIITMTGADVVSTGAAFVMLVYSSTDSRWLLASQNL